MEKIIQKAIEGGWMQKFLKENEFTIENEVEIVFTDIDYGEEMARVQVYEMVCDKYFWQALGKACEWVGYECPMSEEHTFMNTEGKCAKCLAVLQEKWLYRGIRFHEINLTEGWDKAIAYLAEITK